MKKKIFSLIVLPVLILGAAVILISLTFVKGALVKEIKEALQSAATATYAAYNQNTGDYQEAQNGDIWKGSYNISKSESLVDNIKEKSGMEVTFFYGDRRVMTSAVDENGERVLGSPAGDTIVKNVLEKGEEYFSKSVYLNGTVCYGYYIPVCQDDSDTPIGMIFVGTNKNDKDAAINRIVYTIIAVAGVVMLACIVLAVLFTGSMTGSLKKSIGAVQSVASGNLKTDIDRKLLNRKDEIGDLSRAIKELQGEMSKSIETIAENAKAVLAASGELENTARDTTGSMNEVGNAVNSIAESASMQASISGRASDNIADMGERIEQTSREMSDMKQNAKAMHESEQKNAETIHKLLESNEEVRSLIQQISVQTSQTNKSVQKIKEATELIASIAEETSLLSLNASIEAARAGENGKGFAVVADQIQKLANMSNESSSQIEEIVSRLMEDSNAAVDIMGNVAGTIENQTNNMNETKIMTDEVMIRLQESMESMNVIEGSVTYLDNARREIVKTVKELSDIAGRNAATTQEVSANANLVSDNFRHIEENTEKLKSISDGLEESIKHFSV